MTTSSSTLDPKIRNHITRYIHTGNEKPIYYPGSWNTRRYFEPDNLQVIVEAIENGQDGLEVINIILKAYKDGWFTHFETIAFALAKCLKYGNEKLNASVYKAAGEICKTPEELLMFTKYTRILKTGNGAGWCKLIRNWYTSKEPMHLAKEITRVRSRYGRSHKSLLRKSHVKLEANDQARDFIVKYTICGLKRAKMMLPPNENTKEIYEYIQKVEDMRHCEDPVAAAAVAQANNFILDHVPGHLITAQEVWDAILPQLSLHELLYNIQRLHNMGFLKSDSTTSAILLSLLNNEDVIKKSKVTPLEVYITLNNYKQNSKPLKYDKAKVALEKQTRRRQRQLYDDRTNTWQWRSTNRHPKELKIWGIDQPANQDIIASLFNLINQVWTNTIPIKRRFLITVDMRNHMFKATNTTPSGGGGDADNVNTEQSKRKLFAECFYNKNVMPGYAAIIVALQIMKREEDAQLAVFTEDGIQIITSIDRNFTSLREAEFILRKANLGRVQLDAPIEWASRMNENFDVFINMVDRTTRYMELDITQRGGRGPGARFGPPPPEDSGLQDHCPVRALQRYRNKTGNPDAK
ncbi:unnamed protein product [Leptidea sinapis]|uniref:TROVE domain-containing protein n=1 Tax=Leptidea sinapis TaxID=189913 RepID=A0A5E4Q5Q8_9NEOP|nr:unnamed protein product [Leptidea sinapis]